MKSGDPFECEAKEVLLDPTSAGERKKMSCRAPWLPTYESNGEPPTAGHDSPAMPQSIAHRGYKKRYPENTISAFSHAVRAGSRGLETDIHLSKDGVVVLSHDPTLTRCFGVKKRVIECDWKYLSTLRTLRSPHEPMPTLADLLEFMSLPENADVWVLLDIKLDNDLNRTMAAIADAIDAVPSLHKTWNERILLGCWTSDYLPPCETYLPTFPIALITISIKYARLFLRVPAVTVININQKVIMGPGGTKLLADARRVGREVFVWTVNEENLMRWSIEKQVNGVLTDDPKLYRKVCEEWEDEEEKEGLEEKITAAPSSSSAPNASLVHRRRPAREIRISPMQRIRILMLAGAAYAISLLLMTVYRERIRRFVRESKYYQAEGA